VAAGRELGRLNVLLFNMLRDMLCVLGLAMQRHQRLVGW
jgi:hypothetical protein